MRRVLKKSKDFYKRSLALVLAVTMLMSTLIVSVLSQTAFAATSISGTIYLNVAANSNWKNKMIVASFDGVTETVTFTGSGDILSATLPSSISYASRMTLTAYPSDYPIELAKAAPSGKYRIITKKYKSRDYLYAWSGSSNNGAWPGQRMTASGDYYYLDLNTKYTNCIFSTGTEQNKSGDLIVRYIGNVAYYDSASFADVSVTSVNIDSLDENKNLFYVNSDASVSVSKYKFNGSTIVTGTRPTIYLYNPNWSSAYVTYDLDDPYQTTVEMTSLTSENGVQYFSCGSVPANAKFRFQPRENTTTGSTNLTAPTTSGQMYIMDSTNYWGTLADLPTESKRIPNNFGEGIYGVTATYFDYMSDEEISNGYLNNTNSFNNRQDEPFNQYLNDAIRAYSQSNKIKTPLYFGNYPSKGDNSQFYRYKQKANNSNAFNSQYYRAVQGLASNSLINNQLYVPASEDNNTALDPVKSPLFDKGWLQGDNSKGKELAKIFDSYFPFVTATDSSTGITKYSFDSTGGGVRQSNGELSGNKSKSDNVYFTWDGTNPVAVNYGKGSDYAVSDGSSGGTNEFQVGGTGFGIFPFNNTSKTSSSSETKTITADPNKILIKSDHSQIYIHAWNGKNGTTWGSLPALPRDEATGLFILEKDKYSTGDASEFLLSTSSSGNDYKTSDQYFRDYQTGKIYTYSGNILSGGVNSVTVSVRRAGSDSTDYGFGVRMDMGFKVPANGMIGEATTTTIPANDLFCIEDTESWGYVQCRIFSGDVGWIYPKKVDGKKYYFTRDQFEGKTVNGLLFTNNDRYGKQTSDYTNLNSLFSNYYMTGIGNKAALYRSGAASSLTITEGADPVTFDYAGDDDLWVYISDDTGHSELVLDIGGAHKFSKGNINFNTMEATVESVDTNYNTQTTEKPAVPSDEVWILNENNYSTLYLKTWNKTDAYGANINTYISPRSKETYTYSDGSTQNFFRYKLSDLGGAREFTINTQTLPEYDSSETYQLYYLNMNTASVPGNAFMENPSSDGMGIPVTHTNNSSGFSHTAGDPIVTKFFGGQQLDPNKTYHMTVFYMERGLIESNLQVSFTMTPVTNNLLVDKVVDIPQINNAELEKAVRENDTFLYYSSNSDASRSMRGIEYTYTEQSGESTLMQIDDEQGVFTLKDTESANFVSQFSTGSTMTVNEGLILNGEGENLSLSERYDTRWNLYGAAADQPASGTGTIAEFDLVGNNPDRNAELELQYINTLKTGGIKISKQVNDKLGQQLNDCNVDFTYQVKLDLRGGTNYKVYPLNYTVTTDGVTQSYYSSDGTISFSPLSEVEITDLPAGATFIVNERVPEGYTCSNNNYTGRIPTDNVFAFTFVNIQSEGNGEITVHKTLDGSNYTGSQFSFTLAGLPSAGDGYVDMSRKTYTADSVNNGAVTFMLNFTEVGKYRFSVTENAIDSDLLGYTGDTNTYYIQVDVGANDSNELVIKETKYYSDNSFTTAKEIENITFENTTEKAQIDINKKNPSGASTGTDGTQFLLIRVTDDQQIAQADVEKIMTNNTLKNAVLAAQGSTSNGKLTFNNLLVYQKSGNLMYNGTDTAVAGTDDYLAGTSTPQRYCVVEYQPTSGYHLNATPYYVTFPIKAAEGETLKTGYYRDSNGYVRKGNSAAQNPNDPYVFSQTFDYVNYPLVVPEASGNGAGAWFTAGMITISVAGALTLAYFSCLHINRKRRKARVNSRKN